MKCVHIQNIINEADILTIAIGMDELSEDKITNEIIKKTENDYNELIKIIKKLNSNKIIIISLYTIKKEETLNIMKINSYLKDITLKNNAIFIDISNIKNDYLFSNNSYYLKYLGHKNIYEQIKKELKDL